MDKIYSLLIIMSYVPSIGAANYTFNFENVFQNTFKNLYGQPLQPCKKQLQDTNGSWDENGKCSQVGGGVHKICINFNDENKDFAEVTGQGQNWSKIERASKPHCVCLGAYALFKSKDDRVKEDLNCDAISETVFDPVYIQSWNHWNGKESQNQILAGINSVYKTCLDKTNLNQNKAYLTSKYEFLLEKLNMLA